MCIASLAVIAAGSTIIYVRSNMTLSDAVTGTAVTLSIRAT